MAEFVASVKLGKPCTDCGREFPPVCMDFHHRDPGAKDFSVSQAKTVTQVQAEIEKCDLICACCHRIRHAGSTG